MRLTSGEDPASLGPAAELNLGREMALEPQARFADDGTSGEADTRSSSWWNYLRCQTCGHTFRRGDLVHVDAAARTVRHLTPGLACGVDPGPAAATGGDRDEFSAGLLAFWPSTAPVTRIEAGDWRLPRPRSPWRAPTCLYCGHTFRAGEYVVICPCQADQRRPAACGTAVHRDPAAGLPCWDNWQPSGRLNICPMTLAMV